MVSVKVIIRNISGVNELRTDFDFSSQNIIVITGKNGVGKTTLVKSFKLITDPRVFQKSTGIDSIRADSNVSFVLDGHQPFSFTYNSKINALDTRQRLPDNNVVKAELPIPFGDRFKQFSLVAQYDSEIRVNIASSNYQHADELQDFLCSVYSANKFSDLKVTSIEKYKFYFVLRENDYYIREDHLSSGEFFLIQLFRLITSGSELIIIDELDVSLDASAQVNLFQAIKPLLDTYKSRLIVMSHSLAFMSTVNETGLYYLEENNGFVSLEQRSYGYVKSDLYGFRGKDRYIITEDDILSGFISYLIIDNNIPTFFQYEIIPVGGQPQIKKMAKKNDSDQIFGKSERVIIVVDKDIYAHTGYKGPSEIYSSPVNDIELFIWQNRDRLLANAQINDLTHIKTEKNRAKRCWKNLIASGQKTQQELYALVVNENRDETDKLIEALRAHLCLP